MVERYTRAIAGANREPQSTVLKVVEGLHVICWCTRAPWTHTISVHSIGERGTLERDGSSDINSATRVLGREMDKVKNSDARDIHSLTLLLSCAPPPTPSPRVWVSERAWRGTLKLIDSNETHIRSITCVVAVTLLSTILAASPICIDWIGYAEYHRLRGSWIYATLRSAGCWAIGWQR